MANEPKKSRRGYYYDLNESPYEFENSYGDLYKFPSAKQLEIYSRNVQKELEKLNKTLDKLDCKRYMTFYVLNAVYRSVYRSLYNRMGY